MSGFKFRSPLLDPHDLSSLAHLAPRKSPIQEGKMSIAHFGIHGIGLQSKTVDGLLPRMSFHTLIPEPSFDMSRTGDEKT